VLIDEKPVAPGTLIDDVVRRLRGKPKTSVAVSLIRAGQTEPISLTMVREIIKTESVRGARILSDGIGYIEITEFTESTGDQFAKALDGLLKQGIDSLVLDLRNNPGGLLDAAVQVAELFFKKGEIVVYTQGRTPANREDFRSEIEGEPLSLPVAILINGGSASAAEVVTGAMKDTGRAVVVGERSFGKGSVQSIFPLKSGEGLRLTTARYYTPSGISIHEKGIAPQVEVVMTPEEDNQLSIQRSRTDVESAAEFEDRFGFAPIEDRQLNTAVDVLLGVQLLGDRSRSTGLRGQE
jgi:carboxyl-terminal processing protease